MRWAIQNGNPWRRRFAFLPLRALNLTGSGPDYECGWLCWYWTRSCGDTREVTFTNPTTGAAP
jgi:hypothetical protein